MTCAPVPPTSNSAVFPPQLMMWAGMYAVLFTIAGGMIAYMYNPD
jgi:hypothetical protein